ncbi:hypothetical protein [Paenibacillus crassostreae]|uniref:Uncharacterized protein n=1 Tax=Paenibacillus crassostreae TaxID=1763538 RepID=A0A167DQE4_9BACL|nr:hypothetical protein [Paenibacillus crassostreae]AOZ91181.1 hypothetical protein LPB68_02450 [Paenibacillus crassostreae]OAB74660.1 hypothetical protein PNBC_11510 [Paenibacillus crassostreae]
MRTEAKVRCFGGNGQFKKMLLDDRIKLDPDTLGLALHKLFVLDFQFDHDMGFFIFWHLAVPDMLHNHFRYIL